MSDFFPICQEDVAKRGWDGVDFVCVTGDAYVDHPSFGAAIIARVLESQGFRIAVLAQPSARDETDFRRFGRPALGFLITGGNIDSMVANYTAARRRRSDDPYSPGNRAGSRPDRALNAYARLARRAWPDCPIMWGGVEASLRRFAIMLWDDAVRPSAWWTAGRIFWFTGWAKFRCG
jgi:uncharacterized radical SAM protein YgiQ